MREACDEWMDTTYYCTCLHRYPASLQIATCRRSCSRHVYTKRSYPRFPSPFSSFHPTFPTPPIRHHPHPLLSKETNKGEKRKSRGAQCPIQSLRRKLREGRTRRVRKRMEAQREVIAAGTARLALMGCWSDPCFRDCCVAIAAAIGVHTNRGRYPIYSHTTDVLSLLALLYVSSMFPV